MKLIIQFKILFQLLHSPAGPQPGDGANVAGEPAALHLLPVGGNETPNHCENNVF